MVLSAEEYEFKERVNEQRVYSPRYPIKRDRPFLGKTVHVAWMPPVWTRVGAVMTRDARGFERVEPAYTPRWFGFVKELGRQVPEEDLLPLKETPHG